MFVNFNDGIFMAELMKDKLGLVAVEKIAKSLADVWPRFNVDGFVVDCMDGLEKLELKARIHHIIDIMHKSLPQDFAVTADILIAVPKTWAANAEQDSFGGFAVWPLIDYVGIYGLDEPEKALDVLEVLTPLFSAEFAIRPFINEHFELTFKRLNQWILHENEHVRRLVSEGMRPRLPWGLQLKQYIQNPTEVMKLLELLKDDEAEYVRRSVANNLNDIAKDHPKLVVDTCKTWLKTSTKTQHVNRLWVAKRATRSLVKQGYPPVFGLLGFTDKLDIKVENLKSAQANVNMGEALEFSFELVANITQKFVLDYAIYFMKSNGKLAPKVFKLKNIDIEAGQRILIEKQQPFKLISTRKYYAGTHKLEILLNGESYGMIEFNLNM